MRSVLGQLSGVLALLPRGEFDRRQSQRIGDGREVSIEASCNPVFKGGWPVKVVKFATDITAFRLQAIEDAEKISVIVPSQAIIEFNVAGEILTPTKNSVTRSDMTYPKVSK